MSKLIYLLDPGPGGGGGGSYTGPGDIVPGAKNWGGLRAYSAATRGTNCVRLRRSTDNAEQDFATDAITGALDVAAIATFKGAGQVYVVYLYDQIGGNNPLTQLTTSQQPELVLSGLGSLPVMRFVRASTQALASNTSASAPGGIQQPFALSAVAKRTGSTSNFGGVISAASYGVMFSDGANNVSMYAGTVVYRAGVNDNVWHTLNCSFNGASSRQYVDGTGSTVNPGSSNPGGSTISIGETGSSYLDGDVVEVGWWDDAFTDTQAGNLAINQSAYWGV